MNGINIYRLRTQEIDASRFSGIVDHLDIKAETHATDLALAAHDEHRALAYAQPGGKMAGVLLYIDNALGAGEISRRVLGETTAKRIAEGFLEEFDLLPRVRAHENKARVALSLELETNQPMGIVFDGRERRAVKSGTRVTSRFSLDGVAVVGPRAKIRLEFKAQERPRSVHVSAWEDLELYETAELVREHDVMNVLRERLARRHDDRAYYDVRDVKLAYFAAEYEGGPDLLRPFYFIEVEFSPRRHEHHEGVQGIRQLIQVPAYR